MKKSKSTWILVADGMRARFFERHPDKKHLSEIEALDRTDERPPHGRPHLERLGRVFDSYGLGRHAMEPRTELGETEENRFIAEVIDILSEAFADHQFDRFVVVAPPDILGKFRKAMPKNLENALVETMNKELTVLTTPQLEDYFMKHHGSIF